MDGIRKAQVLHRVGESQAPCPTPRFCSGGAPFVEPVSQPHWVKRICSLVLDGSGVGLQSRSENSYPVLGRTTLSLFGV